MGMVTYDQIAAVCRRLDKRCSDLEAVNADLSKRVEELSKPTGLNRINMLRAAAARIVPYTYVLEIAIGGAVVARTPGQFQITQEGCFLCHRIRCSWRLTAGANAGNFRALSEGNPMIMTQAAALVDEINFLWELVEGRASRARQSNARSGDLLYRCDRDGYLALPDEFGPASTVQVFVTPLVATGNAGILMFEFEGEQLLAVAEG